MKICRLLTFAFVASLAIAAGFDAHVRGQLGRQQA
jgi:hypothetical protein